MKCAAIREKLADYSVELLDPHTSQLVDAHLDLCADCRAELRALNAVVKLVETHGSRQPPAGLFNGIRNQIEAGRAPQQRPAWWAWLLTPPVRAGAMGLALGVLALGLFMPVDSGTPLPPSPQVHPTEASAAGPATTALASSIRQHAFSAGMGPLTDRVAWEAVAQLVTPDSADMQDGAPPVPQTESEVE